MQYVLKILDFIYKKKSHNLLQLKIQDFQDRYGSELTKSHN